MGYFVEGIALVDEISLAPLEDKLDYKFQLYKIDETGLFLLDSKDEDYPFTTGIATSDEGIYPIPEHLTHFRKICRKLGINTPYLPKAVLGLPCLISKEYNIKAAHFSSDDDDTNVFILFSSGRLEFIKFLANDLLVTVTETNISVMPLIIEIEEEATDDEALSALQELDYVEVLERTQEYDTQLHAMVEKELSDLCGSPIEILEDSDWESYKFFN